MIRMKYFFALFLLLYANVLPGQEKLKHSLYVIREVNIITMSINNTVIRNATIVIKDNKIVSINGPVPYAAQIIEGKGKWLIPGLIDMHVHVPVDGHFNTNYTTQAASIFSNTQDIMTPFVANGVTTIAELNSRAGHFGQRNEILRADVIGPRMALAAMINGGDENGRTVNTPEDGRQAVRSAKAEGYELIKVYSKLNAETYKAIVDEAEKQGMNVVGHIPNVFKGKIGEAFVPHFSMVAHAEEFFKQTEDQEQDPKQLALLAKANGTWLTPTLIAIVSAEEQGRSLNKLKASANLQYVHPLLQSKWLTSNNYNRNANPESIKRLGKMIAFNKSLVKACKENGVPVVAGTDAGMSGVIWGFSLHDELELLVDAGLTPEEALSSASRLPAVWLGLESVLGTIEINKFADLILLDANPLDNISNVRKIAGVFVNGRWISRSEIKKMLRDLAMRNASAIDQYQWSKRAEY